MDESTENIKMFCQVIHLQIAMPSSLACGAYAESLDDIS
jgi:hypothetical protein